MGRIWAFPRAYKPSGTEVNRQNAECVVNHDRLVPGAYCYWLTIPSVDWGREGGRGSQVAIVVAFDWSLVSAFVQQEVVVWVLCNS